LLVNKKNFAGNLLEAGFAYVDTFGKLPARYSNELKQTEEKAKEKKTGIWGANISVGKEGKNTNLKKINETKNVTISEISDASEFYLQSGDNKELDSITKVLASFKDSEPKLEEPVKLGTPCVAKFSADKCWYRARVIKHLSKSEYGVTFIDFGNYDELDINSLRKCPANLLQ